MFDEFVASVLSALRREEVHASSAMRRLAQNVEESTFNLPAELGYQLVILSEDQKRLLVDTSADVSMQGPSSPVTLPTSRVCIEGAERIAVLDDQVVCMCAPGVEPAIACDWLSVRAAFLRLLPKERSMVSYALQWRSWLYEYRFCSSCGGELVNDSFAAESGGKQCSECARAFYPPVHPCIVVGVVGPKGILLVRAHHYEPGRFSVVAGFVEAGESAEECARREVQEETGVRLGHLAYMGSQSWPFPRQLMLGYLALLHDDDIGVEPQAQASELSDARWFKPDNLPSLPSRGTLSRRLIDLSLDYWQAEFG